MHTKKEAAQDADQTGSSLDESSRRLHHIRDELEPDLGEHTDTQSTHSSTSTPTTADLETVSSVALSPAYNAKRAASSSIGQLIKRHSQLKTHNALRVIPSAADAVAVAATGIEDKDNLSTSIATTSTTASGTGEMLDLDNVATSSRHAAHPSAAFAESLVGPASGAIVPGTPTHRRVHSATSYISVRSLGVSPSGQQHQPPRRNRFFEWIRVFCRMCCCKSSGIGEPSVHHALVVIFLEFFAWGLLTMPIISTLNQTFPDHTFLMNGLVMGIKGILSFLAAPLIGALSDIWGRKFFLLVTVFFTCLPIPLMSINTWWFFAMISISGAFAVTFSVVFAYVADVTTVEERSKAYGLASATFAASLVISPALGNALMDMYGDTLVVALSTAIAVLDVLFILVAVPESLSEKMRPATWGAPISWEQADPFMALRRVGTDKTVLMLCLTVLLSYLPEAGEYSCMFVYLKLKMGFNYVEVSIFIAIVGILSITVQVTLGSFMSIFGAKRTIIVGLALEMIQMLWYGFGSQKWMMWSAGVVAALGSITYPAISAFVSLYAAPESQGAVQGMITGMRGLCNGLGPAVFGVIFYLFNVDLTDELASTQRNHRTTNVERISQHVPGPPFVFGALCVFCAIIVAIFIPENQQAALEKKRVSLDVQYEIESGHKAPSSLAPLIRSDSLAQL
ncbi:hippocampus abundant transcript 1 protein isoform X1 [Scaptodrosophila lebanonensis]|uniref:Hippocampus abundant transcript 1 protein isoform X1 n=1 Tax=Drosophila lebanonensis TaxID=7225 RepID=A0A6J2UAP6_DROLE|nr:hippocampus abundant transcript 1 protein isoform X1 [Scaptodrosophila lebanonensis]XP_030385420.1 hippocampus abundant transcript 1 protein isoform X1 [Scaptodrosophila lebanonensis]